MLSIFLSSNNNNGKKWYEERKNKSTFTIDSIHIYSPYNNVQKIKIIYIFIQSSTNTDFVILCISKRSAKMSTISLLRLRENVFI